MFAQSILRFFRVKRPVLGRWFLHDTSKKYWKIDMANIDHCGTCTLPQKTNAGEKGDKGEKKPYKGK